MTAKFRPPLDLARPTLCLASALLAASPAAATVHIDVDLTAQRMHVAADSGVNYDWPISSGAPGNETPRGQFRPVAMFRMIYSFPKYNREPMPFTIVFNGYYAIHGTREVEELGRPASHGCVRLAPDNAETLFNLVSHEGATIRIEGDPPPPPHFANHGGL